DFLEAVSDYERNYADKEQTPHSVKGKVTQPHTAPPTLKAMKYTMMDEAATLLARPRHESPSPHKSPLGDEDDIPTKLEESSPAGSLAYPLADRAATASPDPPGAETTHLAVDTRPAQPAQSKRGWRMAVGAVGLLLAGTAAGAILFSRRSSPESAPRTEAAK